jgi:transcriptional regulator GlxA family with amidase domain
LRHPLAVKELAAHFHMSRSAFSHHFTAVTGTTPAACMLELRLQEATQLLLHTRQNLATIASATGFADANHLCKVFRRWRHMSPGMLRQYLKSD